MKVLRYAAVALAVCFALEYFFSWRFFREIVPFPDSECWLHVLNGFLRDALLLGVLLLLYAVRKRLRDRCQRYFPVVAAGAVYLCTAFFMVSYLELDWGFLTLLSILTGLFNNIVLVLLAAMGYHHWPGKIWKGIYFLVYFFTCLIMLFDAVYFWNTSMRVESVFFKNLNIYAFEGVAATLSFWQFLLLGLALLFFLLMFRVSKPHKKKPNFTWSLLCVIVFGLCLNLSYLTLDFLVHYATDQIAGLDLEVELEKNRQVERNKVAFPSNVNFVHKALFDTDKVVKNPQDYKKRILSDKDKAVLIELGIEPERVRTLVKSRAPQYDRVVMLVLESVHRDYLHYYNDKIPAQATVFLDRLMHRYPHLNHYYSSDIPTTQGLNATFRSQIIYDSDLPGKEQPSIFRSVQAQGWRGIFINASSRYYANEFREYPEQFGMQEYYAKEDLALQGYKGASGWGYHNDVMYKEALRLLEKHRQEKLFMVVKTLDMHQPYPYYGIDYAHMPPEVRDSGIMTLCGMYWVDHTLRDFFQGARDRGLMDERTLFIITSDHNPHSGGEYKTLVKKEEDTKSIAPIPLIFVSKNLEPLDYLRTEDYASQEDLAPTLLMLLGVPVPEGFMGRNLLESGLKPYALGYFGGKGYYYSEGLSFVAQLDEPYPDTPQKDALANYLMYHYVQRHLKYGQ